jgi:hypothetical protein
MKKLCCLLLILFSLTAAAAEPPARNKTQTPEKKTTQQVLPQQKPQPDKKIKTTGKTPAKKSPEITPFIPSEKIDADAVVAFPVDI